MAKALRLGSALSHTKSALNKTCPNKTNQGQQKDIHMETFKSSTTGGFTKLSDGSDREGHDAEDRDRADSAWSKDKPGHNKGMSDSALNVVVTRTVEIQSEDLESGFQLRSGDHVHYNAEIGRAG